MADALTIVANASGSQMKKQLKVIFDGEEGIDQGGPTKEFFQLIILELFDPVYGMWTSNEETQLFWPRMDSFEAKVQYELMGSILGLALYNQVILDLHFPVVFYKKLLGVEVGTLEDLESFEPTLARSLRQLLAFEPAEDVETTFSQTLAVTFASFGKEETVDLIPDGRNIPVNGENRTEYAKAYANWKVNLSVEIPFSAFKKGFRRVCGGKVLDQMIVGQELEQLICGNPQLDFYAWERGAAYQDGFEKNSITIRYFWEVVHSLDTEEQKKLLCFITGSDRAPLGGLEKLELVISRNGPSADRLPSAHTCFNHLLLPDYQDKVKLHTFLRIAIDNFHGFGLQ
eukprot:Platyproteum_vivax@DN4189_c0_g1_i1.p2